MLEINVSVLKGMMPQEIDAWAVKTLLSLMYNSAFDEIFNGLERAYYDISRKARLKSIKNLIKENIIESQDDLLNLLVKEGYDVTQATLSRDLKLLKVGKVPDGKSGYMYALPGEDENGENEAIYVQDFLRGYISIDFSGNIVVIKTFPGHANTVCNALDNLNMDEVLGTVAGDNCMFACLREGVTGDDFMEKLKKHIPGIES